MALFDTLFPWPRKAELEHEVQSLNRTLEQRGSQLAKAEARIALLEREIRLRESLTAADKREHQRLRKMLEEAHFRNPVTGRLGRKGQVFR